jgi:hypothetical protein
MAKKRRTSNVQRQRASAEALNRRIDEGSGSTLPDWRLLLIGGVIVVGVLILALVLIFGGGPAENVGVQQADDGRTHVADGTDCRNDPAQCGTDPYSSVPAVSGPHWGTPAAWGVYSSPLAESQSIHNLEHGGIVIWYDPEALTVEQIDELTTYVQNQNATGLSGRYKFILSPWGGSEPLPSPVVGTAWRWILELDTVDTAAIDEFARAHYGQSPEPNGGPGPTG